MQRTARRTPSAIWRDSGVPASIVRSPAMRAGSYAWKLSQNRPPADIDGVLDGLRHGIQRHHEVATLIEMHRPTPIPLTDARSAYVSDAGRRGPWLSSRNADALRRDRGTLQVRVQETTSGDLHGRHLRVWCFLAVALGAAVAVAWLVSRDDDIHVVRGRVTAVDVNGVGIGVDGEGYVIGTGRHWQGVDGAWHDGGQPECLPPMSRGATIELA